MTKTLTAFLLDRSGSMAAILDATIEAFNAYVGGLRSGAESENIIFSLTTFDSVSFDTLAKNVAPKDAPLLSRDNYVPRGGTPLIDASMNVIEAVEKKLAEMPIGTKAVVCIQTDGQENESRKYTWADLKAKIEAKQEAGWQFNFMGAGIDAYQQAAHMGISAGQTMSYDSDDVVATAAAFSETAANTMSFSSGRSMNTGYSSAQKLRAGDKFDPSLKKKAQGSKDDIDI